MSRGNGKSAPTGGEYEARGDEVGDEALSVVHPRNGPRTLRGGAYRQMDTGSFRAALDGARLGTRGKAADVAKAQTPLVVKAGAGPHPPKYGIAQAAPNDRK